MADGRCLFDDDADVALENGHLQLEIVDHAAGPAVDQDGDGAAAVGGLHFLAGQGAGAAAAGACGRVGDREILDD